jgi:hypothetical protein
MQLQPAGQRRGRRNFLFSVNFLFSATFILLSAVSAIVLFDLFVGLIGGVCIVVLILSIQCCT